MRAKFDYAALFHDDDGICALHGREPVGDDDGRAIAYEVIERALHKAFGFRIEG